MKKYILIADPSRLSRFVLDYYLSDKYNIIQASSFSEAVSVLNDLLPSLVIVSYELQDGLGFDLCKYLQEHERLSNIPAIMLSSNDDIEHRRKAFEFGVIDFISKTSIDENFVKYIDETIEIIDKSFIESSNAFLLSKDKEIISAITNILDSIGVKTYFFNSTENLLNKLKDFKPDIVISEIFIEDTNCFKITRKIKSMQNSNHIPVVALVEDIDNTIVRNFIIHGISDYIEKNNYSLEKILLSLNNQIKTKKLNDELQGINKELYKKATTDTLTSLFNRRYFLDHFEQSFYNLNRYNQSCAIVMFDIDFFKRVNDNYGHDVGDIVLKEFSNQLSKSFRKTDILARFGGEEFIALIHNITPDGLIVITNNFLKLIRDIKIDFKNNYLRVTASIGAVLCSSDYKNIDAVIKEADELLYQSKENGRNRATLKILGKVSSII